MAQVTAGAGKRAVGTRARVMSHLTAAGDITDPGGMASAALARAIGYPGSSVAFAQLLSAMERSGLIERDVRGKRTYRIAMRHTAAPQWAVPVPDDTGIGTSAPATGTGLGLDYDELARHLLARVLTRGPAGTAGTGGTVFTAGQHQEYPAAAARRERARADEADQDGALDAPAGTAGLASRAGTAGPARPAGTADPARPAGTAGLASRVGTADPASTVARLERKLADVHVRQSRLREENARLLEQIRQAQRRLAAVQERVRWVRPDPETGMLIERLLASLRDREGSSREADAG